MKVLITGGFGYLGGRLAQFLASQTGSEVVLGSRLSLPSPPWLPQVQTVSMQWDSEVALEQVCTGVDSVVHLAGMNAQACAADPAAALEFNAAATARLVRAAARMRVKRFVYLSTAHVYGRPLAGVITENTCPVSLHPYATSHRAGEDAVRYALQGGAIEGIVIRLSNAYGAPAHKDTDSWMLLVNDLCRQAVLTHTLVLHSPGLDRRDFVPLPDVCAAIDHLLRLPTQNLGGGVFNVGGDWSPTVWEMARIIQERCVLSLGFRPELTRVEPPAGAAGAELHYRLDALMHSGFEPRADRLQEIDRLLACCREWFQ